MAAKRRGWLLGGVIASSVAGVVIYNFWAYCCGRCRIENFLTLGPYGKLLIGLNSAAAAAWLIIRRVKTRSDRNSRCSCGTKMQAGWNFCARCGQAVTLKKKGVSTATVSASK